MIEQKMYNCIFSFIYGKYRWCKELSLNLVFVLNCCRDEIFLWCYVFDQEYFVKVLVKLDFRNVYLVLKWVFFLKKWIFKYIKFVLKFIDNCE